MDDIIIAEIDYGTEAYWASFALRNRVLGVPFGLDLYKLDMSADRNSRLICAFSGNMIVGTTVLTPVVVGTYRMRQVATDPVRQHRGIGTKMLKYAEDLALREGYARIQANARLAAAGFYDRQGYARQGEIFMEVGLPHVKVEKCLSVPTAGGGRRIRTLEKDRDGDV